MRQAAALLLLAGILDAASSHGATPARAASALHASGEREVEVRGPRVHASDVLGAAFVASTANTTDVDLGATPAIGSSRIIEKAEIERAFAEANVPPPAKIPAKVRVARKTKKLSASDVGQAVRTTIGESKLSRGASLVSVSAMPAEVPAEFTRVVVELGALPRKAGIVTIHAPISFVDEGGTPVHKALATVKVSLPAEAAFAEISKGAPIALVIKKGLVEVSISGVAGTDSDVGAILPVTIKPSGRVLRARAIDKDHAVALEDS